MNKKFLVLTLLTFLLVPESVSADVITPTLSHLTVPIIPFIVLIEAFVFWILVNKVIKVKTGFLKLVLVALVANVVTSIVGAFFPLFIYTAAWMWNLTWIGIAYLVSVFVEWAIYIPFFRKVDIKRFDLLKISFAVNLATYIPISLLIIFA
jgi:hypothetical protein